MYESGVVECNLGTGRTSTGSPMVRTPAAAAPEEGIAIKIKAVMPCFPASDEEVLQLEEDLGRMSCS